MASVTDRPGPAAELTASPPGSPAAALTHQTPHPGRGVTVSRESAPLCLQQAPVRISAHLCPHRGGCWLPQTTVCHGAEIGSAALLRERHLGAETLPVGHGGGLVSLGSTHSSRLGRGQEGPGTGRALRRDLRECAGGE